MRNRRTGKILTRVWALFTAVMLFAAPACCVFATDDETPGETVQTEAFAEADAPDDAADSDAPDDDAQSDAVSAEQAEPAYEITAEGVTLPVYWYKETGIGSSAELSELTDSEAMWWDANQKVEKSTLFIPADHPIAVSTSEGAVLWTPYTLPKTTDLAEGMPLHAYAFYFGKHEIMRADANDKGTYYMQLRMPEVPEGHVSAYEQNIGIAVADNPEMDNAMVVFLPEKGYEEDSGLSLRVIYKDDKFAKPVEGGETAEDEPETEWVSGGNGATQGGTVGDDSSMAPFAILMCFGIILWLFLFLY